MPPQVPGIKVEAPTLENLPKLEKKEDEFNYSLCDSVDYQQESIPKNTNPQMYALDPAMLKNAKVIAITPEQLAQLQATQAVQVENASMKISSVNQMQ